jgi:hypothetical protein
MGIFSRLFRGQDGGGPPDGQDPPDDSDSTDTEPVPKHAPEDIATQPTGPASASPQAPHGAGNGASNGAGNGAASSHAAFAGPAGPAQSDPWAWPGSQPRRAPEPEPVVRFSAPKTHPPVNAGPGLQPEHKEAKVEAKPNVKPPVVAEKKAEKAIPRSEPTLVMSPPPPVAAAAPEAPAPPPAPPPKPETPKPPPRPATPSIQAKESGRYSMSRKAMRESIPAQATTQTPPPTPPTPPKPMAAGSAPVASSQESPAPAVIASAPVAAPPVVPAPPVLPERATVLPLAQIVEDDAPRARTDSVNSAFDDMLKPAAATEGVSTPEDLAAVRGIFNEVAVVHVSQVRDVMLELRYGDANPAWLDATRPALQSLRAMAKQMELDELCVALDEFCAAVESTVANRATLTEDAKVELLRRYQRLIDLIPQAFELDAERDRREPVIVESLLFQVEGVERLTVDKLFGVGLNRLDALINAKADEIEVVAGIKPALAAAIVAQFQAYRGSGKATVSAPDPGSERQELADLLIALSLQNDDFNRASSAWDDAAVARKRELRKQRDQTFNKIKVAMARLGERDQLARLEKMPFDERITALDRYLSAQPRLHTRT